jgi:hypothetical protein
MATRAVPRPDRFNTRRPSISISTVEWPSQVTRSPLAGALFHASSGFIEGSGPRGKRRSPPHRKSLIVGIDAFASRRPGMTGCRLRKRSPAQSGEALMRSSRAFRFSAQRLHVAISTRMLLP